MKKTIEIECPDGYKPIYNSKTGNVEIVPENIIDRIKTYEDAKDYLGLTKDKTNYNKSINSLAKLQTILDALNENHKFDLLTGTVLYPWIQFFRMESIPEDAKIIGYFYYKGEKFALVDSGAASVGWTGLGSFVSCNGVGFVYSDVGILACKSEEIAKYVSAQFGKLLFDACFAKHFEDEEFKWLA